MRRMLSPISALSSWLRSLRNASSAAPDHRLRFSRYRGQGSSGLTALSPAAGRTRLLARRRFGIDVGGRQVEVVLLGELFQLRVDPAADRATGACQQLDVATTHGTSAPVRFICRGFGF
jgi:hypothetical protein